MTDDVVAELKAELALYPLNRTARRAHDEIVALREMREAHMRELNERCKIVPIGGKHRSAQSLLAEIMQDPGLDKCWVISIDKEGNIGWGHYGMTRAETAYAGAMITRFSFEEEE